MIVFVRYFTLLAGFYVPRNTEVWGLYILLRKLLEKVMSHTIYESDEPQVKNLIEFLLFTYCTITKDKLKPKFHFLLHYPKMLLNYGPLAQLSTMRFEAKHKVSKVAARSSCNRLNICKTVVYRNQLSFNHFLSSDCQIQTLKVGKETLEVDLDVLNNIKCQFNLDVSSKIYSVKWIIIEGKKLQRTSVLIENICPVSDEPILVQIDKVFLTEAKEIFLACSRLNSLGFDDHYQTFELERHEGSPVYLSLNDLYSRIPHNLSILPDCTFHVTLRCRID